MVVGLFVFDLMAGMVAINIGPAAWQWWVDLQRNPLNLLLTVLALAAAAIRTVPWFQLTPSIIKVLKVHPPEVVRMAVYGIALLAPAVGYPLCLAVGQVG